MKTLCLYLLLSAFALNAFAQTTIVLPRFTDSYIWGDDQGMPGWELSNTYAHTYNSRGQEMERVYLNDGIEWLRTVHTYENFRLMEVLEQSKSSTGAWETTSKSTYMYDSQERLITITNQAFNSASSQLENLTRIINTYTNDDLNPSSVERQRWSESLNSWGLDEKDINLVWSIDSNHPFKLLSYETQVVDFDLSWFTLERHNNSYDPVTRTLTSSTDFASRNNGWVPSIRMITTFDAQMNPTRLLVQEWDYDKWKFLGDTQYLLTYNPDNVLTERITKIRMVDGGALENLSRDVYRDFQTFNVTGLAEQLPESSLAVFPNPTSSDLTISLTGADFKQAQVQLFNLQGKKMYEAMASYQSISTGNHEIPCQQLGAGVYVLRIITDNNKGITRRVVKMK